MEKEITIEEGCNLIHNFWVSQGGKPHMAEDIPFYESDWSMLMPVVEKIEEIEDEHHGHFGVYINSNGCSIQATNLRTGEPMANPPHYFDEVTADTKIQATWQAVVQFILWYNHSTTTIKP